jgi:hypothetical protein
MLSRWDMGPNRRRGRSGGKLNEYRAGTSLAADRIEELAEILRDNEAVFTHVMAVSPNGQSLGSSAATLRLLGDGR